ncbi:MAG TPA: PDZ domain-containing protein, partial [Candidatus Methylomirabilis sp.]|nr:PDZ domain-containing protein [Candidatus Methylomirabilis sp.]
MGRGGVRERVVWWTLIGIAVVIAFVAIHDGWRRVGHVWPGFALMENAQTGAGGAERAGLHPFDAITAVNGRAVSRAADIVDEVRRHPPGTALTYTIDRAGRYVTAVVPTRTGTLREFGVFLIDGTIPGLLVIALGALVLLLRPGAPESRVFLAFCLVSGTVNLTYNDLMSAHRFSRLFLTVWPFLPAILLHLAGMFPERRRVVERWPWLVWVPYAVSAVLAV